MLTPKQKAFADYYIVISNLIDETGERWVNYTNIPKDSWYIIERVLLRYPDTKKDYEDMREQLLEGTPLNDGLPRSNYPASRMEEAVVKLQSPRMQRMEREIKAVEKAYAALSEEQRKVIRVRYWTCRWRKVPYTRIRDCHYSERQMHRICTRVIRSIGKDIGEIT